MARFCPERHVQQPIDQLCVSDKPLQSANSLVRFILRLSPVDGATRSQGRQRILLYNRSFTTLISQRGLSSEYK